jgi:hypothetical protein
MHSLAHKSRPPAIAQREGRLIAIKSTPSTSPAPSEMKRAFALAEIQGRSWGVIVETGAAGEHLESARAIDALGNAVMDEIEGMVDQAWEAFVGCDVERLAGILQALKTAIPAYKNLDRKERAHWDRKAPERVANAHDEGFAISQLAESQLAI